MYSIYCCDIVFFIICILIGICYGAGLDSLGCDASRAGKAMQGMRQVTHKLQRLHGVWQNVLPHSVYIKAISKVQGSPGREGVHTWDIYCLIQEGKFVT